MEKKNDNPPCSQRIEGFDWICNSWAFKRLPHGVKGLGQFPAIVELLVSPACESLNPDEEKYWRSRSAPCDKHQAKEAIKAGQAWHANHSFQLDSEA